MKAGPKVVLALGAALAALMLAALWLTSEPRREDAASESAASPQSPEVAASERRPDRPPQQALPARRPTAAPPTAAGEPPVPLTPGRTIPLPPDQWPERVRPTAREVATPPVRDTAEVRKEDIRAAIETVKPLIAQCFHDAAQRNAGDQRVVLRFTIEGQGTSGYFRDGEVVESTIPDPWVQACFLEALTDARFPAPVGGGTVTVTYPFAFVDSSDAGPQELE